MREARRFAPSLQVHFHHGDDRPDALTHLGPGHVVVDGTGEAGAIDVAELLALLQGPAVADG